MKTVKKMLSILTSILIILNTLPLFAAAKNNTPLNSSLSVEITVTERNAETVLGYPVRRSIPFKEGVLFPDTELVIKDGDRVIPSDTEVMETYPDGSVRWLLVSFTVDIGANEKKVLYLTEGSYDGALSYNESTGVLTNGNISMVITPSGIQNIGKNGIASEKIEMYVRENDETFILNNADISVLSETESYIKARISGNFTSGIEGVMEITLAAESERVQIDYRINTKRNVRIVSTGLFITGNHNNTIGSRISENVLSFPAMDVISYDNQRFNGAIKNSLTGFTIDDENTVRLAPLLHFTNKNSSYMFYDGTARTCHVYLCFGDSYGHSKAVSNPLSVSVSPTVYKDAGILYSDILTSPAKEMIDTIKTMKGKLDGRFEAGSIPLELSNNLEVTGGFNARPGETEYNLGYGYMMSGEEDLYTLIMDSAENWADVVIYKGQYSQIYGANRSHTGEDLYNGNDVAFRSFPYYGEAGGLYMAYILSGNEYFKEIFLASCDHFVNTMYLKDSKGNYLTQNFGNFMISKWFWKEDGSNSIGRSDFTESRYMMPARPLYLAYQLTGKEDYRRAAMDIAQWAADKQQPDGSWPQAYFHYKVEKILDENGNQTYDSSGKVRYKKVYYDENETYDDKYGAILIQEAQQSEDDIYEGLVPYKLYIMLFGYRGVTDVMHWEENDMMRETLLKFADYLCYQNESFGPGLYHPNGDRDVYPENEDSTFSKGTATDLMALEVLAKAYEISGNTRHLKNMCSLLESYLCSAYGGLSFDTISETGYKGFGLSPVLGRSMTYLKSASYISYLMEKNSGLISQLGYDNLLIAFGRDARSVEFARDLNSYAPLVTHNEYVLNGQKALFAAANSPLNINNNGCIRLEMSEDNLWQGEGVINCVESTGKLIIQKNAKQFQLLTALQRPIKITPYKGSRAQAEITEYNDKEVKINISGVGGGKIHISNGLFPIKQGASYKVSQVQNDDDTITVTISAAEGQVQAEDTLEIDVIFSNEYYYDNFNRNGEFDTYIFSTEAIVKDFPNVKDKSLYLTEGESMSTNLLNDGRFTVISQDFYCESSDKRYCLMQTQGVSINACSGGLYLNNESKFFANPGENRWFKLTVVFDKENDSFSVYVDGEEQATASSNKEAAIVTYTGSTGGVYIDNLLVGCYETDEGLKKLLTEKLHRGLNEDEVALIANAEELKKTVGESSAFYKKLDEVITAIKNPMLDKNVKSSYIEMLENLKNCAADKDRWLIMAESFEGDMSVEVNAGNNLGGTKVLSATDAAINGENGALRLQKLDGGKSPVIILQSNEAPDDIEVNFKYMQSWIAYNPYIYYCGDTDQKDYAVRIGSSDSRFYAYNGNNSTETLLLNYEAGRWYDFSIRIHYIARTYDVYIDGRQVAENLAFSSVQNSFQRPDLGRVFNAKTGSDAGAYYYDDIYIYGIAPQKDRVSLIEMNNTLGDYFMARSNIINESLKGEKPPVLFGAVYNDNRLVKLVKTTTNENGLLRARIYAKDLPDGKYTIKGLLWKNDNTIVPLSTVYEREFVVADKNIAG